MEMKDLAYHKQYRGEHKEQRLAYGRELYAQRKKDGLCTKCGMKNDGPYTTCSACRERHKQHKRKHLITESGREKQALFDAKRRGKPERKKYRREYMRNRYHADVQFRLSRLLTGRVSKLVKGKIKSSRILKLLGCSLDELKNHLEKQFQPGMTWDNHGEWHIDHIIPLASVDLTDQVQLTKVCHYTNLQPLWAADNIRKGANIE